jgi:hypothetical protein
VLSVTLWPAPDRSLAAWSLLTRLIVAPLFADPLFAALLLAALLFAVLLLAAPLFAAPALRDCPPLRESVG